jgi:uncharacterized membrane protein YdjX (TVP38/TMEM64 family)
VGFIAEIWILGRSLLPKLREPHRGLYLLAVLALIGLLVLAKWNPVNICSTYLPMLEEIREAASEWGLAAAFGYIVIYAALMTLLWIPAWLCSVVGGAIFGPLYGVPYALAGATLGATIVFLLARSGIGALTSRAGRFVQKMEKGFEAHPFSYLLFLRLVPLFPFAAVNVVPAALRVPLRTFVIGTFVGIIPSTLIFIQFGSALADLAASRRRSCAISLWDNPRLILALLGLGLLALLPVFWTRYRKSNRDRP